MPPDAHRPEFGLELLERAQAIRLPIAVIATRAGLDKHTILRLRRPSERRQLRTVNKVARVVIEEELRLRDYLLGRYPMTPADAAANKDSAA